jgi:hypothetical protein
VDVTAKNGYEEATMKNEHHDVPIMPLALMPLRSLTFLLGR